MNDDLKIESSGLIPLFQLEIYFKYLMLRLTDMEGAKRTFACTPANFELRTVQELPSICGAKHQGKVTKSSRGEKFHSLLPPALRARKLGNCKNEGFWYNYSENMGSNIKIRYWSLQSVKLKTRFKIKQLTPKNKIPPPKPQHFPTLWGKSEMKSLQNEILQTVQCMKDQVFIVTFFQELNTNTNGVTK